jgi:hypothetical protein
MTMMLLQMHAQPSGVKGKLAVCSGAGRFEKEEEKKNDTHKIKLEKSSVLVLANPFTAVAIVSAYVSPFAISSIKNRNCNQTAFYNSSTITFLTLLVGMPGAVM